MNKFVKGFIIVSIVGGVITACSSVETTESTNTTPTEQNTDSKPTQAEEKDLKAGYEKIVVGDVLTGEGGSTYEQVVQLLGEPDNKTESTSTGIDGKEMKTLMLSWFTLTDGSISVTVTNGKVSHKMFME